MIYYTFASVSQFLLANLDSTLLALRDQSPLWAGTAGGTANALALTVTPAVTQYQPGQSFAFQPTSSNAAGALTLSVSSLSPLNITDVYGSPLQANALVPNATYVVRVLTATTGFIDGPGVFGVNMQRGALLVDASTNVVLGTPPILFYSGNFTSNHTVTLSTGVTGTAPPLGSAFRIVRDSTTGSTYTLSVQTDTASAIKTIPMGSWLDVQFEFGWRETGYGSL